MIKALALFCAAFSLCSSAASGSSIPPVAVKGLAAWYDASDATTLTLGASVIGQVTDKSGNSLTLAAVNSGASSTPTYSASGLNGHPALVFNGTSSYYQSTLSTAPGTNPPHTIFVAGRGTANKFGALVAYSDTASGDQNSVLGVAPFSVTASAWWFGGFGEDGSYAGGSNDGGAHVFTKRYDGTTITGSYDGTAVFSHTQAYNLSGNHILVGVQEANGDGRLSGAIGEVLVYNTALSTANSQYIEG
jgi:hypothetical protein